MRGNALRYGTAVALCAALPTAAAGAELGGYQLDPFAQATSGFAACPAVSPPVLTVEQMRMQAHERVERGTSCCLAKTCECGGAYKHDPDINARVVAAIRDDARFRNASVWVTTMRKFVTLQGCVRNSAQKRALERMVRRQRDVALVWNETTIGTVTASSTPAGKPLSTNKARER